MTPDRSIADAAALFKALGHDARLRIVLLLSAEPRSVGAICDATGLSQPLVSQHLRTLRSASLVRGIRHGKEIVYELADAHVAHVVDDAVQHVRELDSPITAQEERP